MLVFAVHRASLRRHHQPFPVMTDERSEDREL